MSLNITEINFARRVEVLENGCWLWHGSFQPAQKSNGYKRRPLLWSGQGRLNGKMVFAHRYAYESRIGELPNSRYFGLERNCSTELCVNPSHYILTKRKVFANKSHPNLIASIKAKPMCRNGLHERTPENTAIVKMSGGRTKTTCKPCLKKSASENNKRYKAKKRLAK